MKFFSQVFPSTRIFILPLGALLFSVFPAGTEAKRVIDRTAVTVNDEVILESDVEKFLQKIKSKNYQELFGGVDPKIFNDREALLQLLVEEKIMNQQVKKLDLITSEQEVDGQIRAVLKRNGISEPQLKERLKQLGTTMDDYREALKRQLERKNLVDREIKPMLEVSDEQLRYYYQRNSKPEDSETQYKIAHILIEAKPKGGVSAEARSKQIWTEVSQNPENFEKFVKDYSDDQTSAGVGGVLGFFSLSSLAKEFRQIVPKTAVGKVTPPVRTAMGFHIVKVLETRVGDFATLSKEKKESLRNQMASVELEKKMAMWLERKKSEAYIRRAK